ncbi:PREDICTED: uncharacterized protein LOC104812870 [Tarenaya hassleriana]|uniref:uncharacterized protein LOC104812870 n=1 Tax=Tarenaya hassleriana TaxID=28532 RepID=UPI00053C42FA|nr:PREDICTED: uncharacterized protein LOC104812870 [Tarenaya hassleriana]
MMFDKEYLDMVLVPLGLTTVLSYHLILLYRVLYFPYTTVIGFMNIDKSIWVDRIMQARKDELGNALTVLSSSISVSTFLASVSLSLSSLIGAWIGSSPSSTTIFTGKFIYGDTSPTTMIIKYTALLACFLAAFACFVQSTRQFLHANYLLTTPGGDIPAEMVKRAVVRGGNFWSVGLRALYLALDLLIWLFGPIPMLVNSVMMVVILHYLDSNSVAQPLHHQTFAAEQMVKRMGGVFHEPLTYG